MSDPQFHDRLREAKERFGETVRVRDLIRAVTENAESWPDAPPPPDAASRGAIDDPSEHPPRPNGHTRTLGQSSVQSAGLGGLDSGRRCNGDDVSSVQSSGLEDLDAGRPWRRISEIEVAPRDPGDAPVANLTELGKLACLIGDGGVGKSRLTEQIAAGLAVGFLWSVTLPRTYRVLLVNTEDDTGDIKQSIQSAAGIADPDVYCWAPDGTLTAEQLERVIEETGAEVVFINPLIDLLKPQQENDNAEMAARVFPFKRLCLERRVCICFVHHTNKSDGSGRNKARGASSLFDHCALVAELRIEKEDEEWTLFFSKRRGGPKRKPLALRSNGTHFEPTAYVPPATVGDTLDTAIVDLLRGAPGRWFDGSDIVKAVEPHGGRSTTYERLKVVRTRRDVDYDAAGHRYRYRPADDPAPPPHTDADYEVFE